jgi:type II secretory pathway component PulF
MSGIEDKLKDLEEKMTMWQFRSSKKHRFRIYRKLEGMLKTNEALSRALDRLYQNVTEMGKYPKKPAAIALREWFLKDRMGITLSQAMEGWIPTGELYMIRAGEESGTLAKALSSIQLMGVKASLMRKAVSYAIGYPIAMFILVSFVIWTFGVNLIKNMEANAPPNVVAAMGALPGFSRFINDWGLYIVAALIVVVIIISSTLSTWRGALRVKFDKYPPWSWYRVLQGSGFLLGLSSLLGAQVPLKRSMEILEEQGNPWIRERIGLARQEVLRGQNLGQALRITGMGFPDPAVVVDLEILSERADVGQVIEQVTEEWIDEQILMLQAQAVVSRNLGMAVVGGIIAWAMMSIFAVVGELSKPSQPQHF